MARPALMRFLYQVKDAPVDRANARLSRYGEIPRLADRPASEHAAAWRARRQGGKVVTGTIGGTI